MSEPTKTVEDIAYFRAWRDEHTDAKLRHRTMPSDVAWLWGGIDVLLRELDRRIDPDDLTDEQTEIYEKGYVAGQQAAATRLRQLARDLDTPAQSASDEHHP